MNNFTGSEIAFSHTYFSARPDRIVEIRTGSPVHPLSLTEVSETAGSYSFVDDGCGFYNRMLFWRTEGSRIHFNEVCAVQEVNESSICLDLYPSVIVSGTTITFYRGVLIVVIPTPSAIHRLLIRLGNYSDINSGHQSVLSYFPTSSTYHSVYDCHFFPTGTTISRASITHDFYGNTVSVVINSKNQLVAVRMPFVHQTKTDAVSETLLREGSVLSQWFNRNMTLTLSVTLANFDSELFVVSAQNDGKIRLWALSDGSFRGAYSITECLRTDLEFDVDDLTLRAGMCCDQRIIIVKVQLVKKVKFMILTYDKDGLVLLTTCDLYATSAVDFLFVESPKMKNSITIWAITRESYENEKQTDTMFQPYLLHRCIIDLNGTTEWEWKAANPAVPNSLMDKLVFENMTVESIKQRIFDGNTYSFETVQRAIQTICQCSTTAIQYRDWQALSHFTEEMTKSGKFNSTYLSEQDQNSLLTSNSAQQLLLANAYERFWLDVQKCCNQFQETSLYPIALWHSPTLGLVGTIQTCRFTVYIDPDSRMQEIILSHGSAINVFFDIIRNYVISDFQLTSTDCDQQMACKVKTDVLCGIVKWFGEREEEIDLNLVPMKSAFLSSSFTTNLLATALKQRVFSRLCFAQVVSTIIKLLPETFMLAKENFDQRSTSTISSQLSSISSTVKHYSTLWFSLSSTFLSHHVNSSKAAKLVTIAQSFFKSGLPFSHDRSAFMDDDLDELNSEEGSVQQRGADSSSEFSRFVFDALDDAMISLWPESKSMTFPRFLATNKYYESLRDYCEKNRPYVSELAATFYFFQGIAFAGTGKPDEAAGYFEEASQGVVAKDEILNGVLSTYSNRPYPYVHTLTEFYFTVMSIFKSQGHIKSVIWASEVALKFAKDTDPLLSNIYALMFNQYLQSEKYFEAIRVLHMIPIKESQDDCLQALVTTLWDLHRTKSLVDLHYAELTDRVAKLLESKCRLMPLSMNNEIFEVTYAFYMHRYNYEFAARIMYFLCWRLRWIPQSQEVLEKRLRVLSCVCQTVEMLPDNHTISLEVDLKELMNNDTDTEMRSFVDENTTGRIVDKTEKSCSVKNVSKKALYDEYLILEARLILLNAGVFKNGPPMKVSDIYEETISHRLYDVAFVAQRRFKLDISRLFNALTLDCITIGFDDKTEIPNWVFSNARFVDYFNKNEDHLRPHWKLLVAYVDLTLKVMPSDVLALHKVTELFLERSLDIPKWLEVRYLKVNSRYFYHQLIEFDELNYAFKILLAQLNEWASRTLKPQEIHTVPLVHIDALCNLASEKSAEDPALFKKAEQSKSLLSKILRSMKVMSYGTVH